MKTLLITIGTALFLFGIVTSGGGVPPVASVGAVLAGAMLLVIGMEKK